jgi:hypothetical protein
MKQESISKRTILVAALVLVAGLQAGPMQARAGVNPDADEILKSMSTFLAGTRAFSVSIDIGNEVITREGEKLQFDSHGTLVVQRPSRFYATRQGRFADVEMFYDGKAVTVYGKTLNAYLQKDVAGTLDDAIATLESAAGIDLPGTDLLLANPYAVLSDGITSSGYHGTDYVGGVPCHHLSFREDQVDWQLWVKTGDEPLPMKYVITTKWLTGAPQYSAQFGDWNLAPAIAGDRFTFVVPQGAQKLDSLPVDEAGEIKPGMGDKR